MNSSSSHNTIHSLINSYLLPNTCLELLVIIMKLGMIGREGSAGLMESGAPSVKKTAISTSWMLIDHDGHSTILDMDKYVIMRRVKIHARDLRIIDPILSYPSTILRRERVIVLNLEHIKAIVTAEEVLLRDPLDDDVIPIVEEFQRRLQRTSANSQDPREEEDRSGAQIDTETADNSEFPFEFRALEVALEGICSFLDARTSELETAAYPALDELTSKINSRNLDRVRKLKSAMTRLTGRVQKVRDELEQLLDDDDDMADLYLSRKSSGASSPGCGYSDPDLCHGSSICSKVFRASRTSATTIEEENDVEELEMLLEAHFTQIDGTLNKLTTLREYIDDTEDYINIQLDNHRNQLIQLQLFLGSGSLCLSVFSMATTIFGMNIPNTWNKFHPHMFKWETKFKVEEIERMRQVVILAGVASASVFLYIMSYARHKGLIES